MTNDIEELLADGMARYAETISQREGLTRAARARLRRRRIVRAGAAAGTAAAVAIATLVLATSGTRGAPKVLTDAYVIKKVQGALSSAEDNGDPVMYAAISDPVAGTSKNWDYRSAGVSELQGTRGPVITGYSVTGDTVTWTSVDYGTRTWSREQAKTAGDGLLPPSFPDRSQYQVFPSCSASESRGIAALNWPEYLRSELTCGAFRYEGYATLGGARVIKLTAEYSTARSGDVSETLWVDPQTYLPVRAVSQLKFGSAPPGFLEPGTYDPSITTFQWLPPSPANLRMLQITIPPGFRQVK